MNISEVTNDIKLTLGLNAIALPYNKTTEQVIGEILQVSIRTFSRFKPCIKEGIELRKNLRSPSDDAAARGIYYLPEKLTTTHVQYADAYITSDQYVDGEATMNAFTVVSPFVGFGSYYPQDIMNAQMTGVAINKYAGVSGSTATSKWLGFNKVQLFNFPKNATVQFVVKCDHDPSGETIPDSCVESFTKLATLDVQRTLYNVLKNMNSVGGAFKEIQLKIDDWSGAEAARNDLIEKWTGTFHLDDLELVQFF
jgi:hypothetical protein